MKKKLLKSAFAVGLAAALAMPVLSGLTGCGEKELEKEYVASTWTEMPENTNENLKYFAYFHSDGFNGGEEYFTDIAALNNANVMMINSAFDIAVGVERLELVRALGMKAFVTAHGIFGNQQVGKVGSAVLNANWLTTWRMMKEYYGEFIEDGTLLGFYFDEPYWNGIKEEDFLLVTHTMRKECPNVKVMACLTAVEIGAKAGNVPEVSAEYHKYCTDLMYDSYVDWNDEQRRDFAEKLAAKATANQYFWGCPKGFVDSYEEEGNEEMINHIKGFYTEAIQNERYAGIVSFSYAGGLDGGDWGYGLNTFFDIDPENAYFDAELRDLYLQIGREITGRTETARTAPTISVAAQTEIESLGAVEIPVASVTDGDAVLTATAQVYAPDGTLLETENGVFTATYGGRYCVAYTATDADYNTTKIKHGVWVRGVGEVSAFEDTLYMQDISTEEGCGWTTSLELGRTYAGSRGALKVQKTGEENLRLYFENLTAYDKNFTKISAMIYNPSVTAIESLAFFITDGTNTVQFSAPLTAKKWTELALTKEYVLAQCPAFNFETVRFGVMQAEGVAVANFYVDNVLIK